MDLQQYLDQEIILLTTDSRFLKGILKGTDQTLNLILQNCQERIFNPYSELELGLYLVRGDTVVMVGLLDVVRDGLIAWDTIESTNVKPLLLNKA